MLKHFGYTNDRERVWLERRWKLPCIGNHIRDVLHPGHRIGGELVGIDRAEALHLPAIVSASDVQDLSQPVGMLGRKQVLRPKLHVVAVHPVFEKIDKPLPVETAPSPRHHFFSDLLLQCNVGHQPVNLPDKPGLGKRVVRIAIDPRSVLAVITRRPGRADDRDGSHGHLL